MPKYRVTVEVNARSANEARVIVSSGKANPQCDNPRELWKPTPVNMMRDLAKQGFMKPLKKKNRTIYEVWHNGEKVYQHEKQKFAKSHAMMYPKGMAKVVPVKEESRGTGWWPI